MPKKQRNSKSPLTNKGGSDNAKKSPVKSNAQKKDVNKSQKAQNVTNVGDSHPQTKQKSSVPKDKSTGGIVAPATGVKGKEKQNVIATAKGRGNSKEKNAAVNPSKNPTRPSRSRSISAKKSPSKSKDIKTISVKRIQNKPQSPKKKSTQTSKPKQSQPKQHQEPKQLPKKTPQKSKSKSKSKPKQPQPKTQEQSKPISVSKSSSEPSPNKISDTSGTKNNVSSSRTSNVSKSTPESRSRSSSPARREEGVKMPKQISKVRPGKLREEKGGKGRRNVGKGRSVESVMSAARDTSQQNISEIKEFSNEGVQSSSSIDLSVEPKRKKAKFGYEPSPTSGKEVEKFIDKYAKKVSKKQSDQRLLTRKRQRETAVVKKEDVRNAKYYNYELQRNPNVKTEPIINLEALSKNKVINYSDVLLSLIEVAENPSSYYFPYSPKSKSFWNDILQYKPLKKIFEGFKAETLRKYWAELSKHDSESSTDLIRKNKSYLDQLPLRLGTIVTSIVKLMRGEIGNFQEYINNILIEVRKKEIYEHTFTDPETGAVTRIKDHRFIYLARKKYEPGREKQFKPTVNFVNLQEIFYENPKLTDYQNLMQERIEEDYRARQYFDELKEEEMKKYLGVNEQHKVIFKTIDSVLDAFCKEFKNYSRSYILAVLEENSLDVSKTFLSLKDPKKGKELRFTATDDKIILGDKSKAEYKDLINERGKAAVEEREIYLRGDEE